MRLDDFQSLVERLLKEVPSSYLDGVVAVEGRDHELTISVDEGSSAIGPIAIALHKASVRVRDLTLRTPTLDDVFLELTGAHFDADTVTGEDHS